MTTTEFRKKVKTTFPQVKIKIVSVNFQDLARDTVYALTIDNCKAWQIKATINTWALEVTDKKILRDKNIQSFPQTAFKVIAISINKNSFGLSSVVAISSTGDAYELATNQMAQIEKDNWILLENTQGGHICQTGQIFDSNWNNQRTATFELPRKLPKAPIKVLQEAGLQPQ